MMNKCILILGVVFALFGISTSPVYAYLDPGTGSMIAQAIAALVLTAGAIFGIFRQAVKNFFLGLGNRWKKVAEEKDQSATGNPIKKIDVKNDSHEK